MVARAVAALLDENPRTGDTPHTCADGVGGGMRT